MAELEQGNLPATVPLEGRTYRYVRTLKTDEFAEVGLYECTGNSWPLPEKIVLKLQRNRGVARKIFILRFVGPRLARRELRTLRHVRGLPGVPQFVVPFGACGLIHEYIPGEDLSNDPTRQKPLPADFFDTLERVVLGIHARNMVVIDVEKPDNLLIGDDGLPYLVDFQIARIYPPRPERRGCLLGFIPTWRGVRRWFFRCWRGADIRHIRKNAGRLWAAHGTGPRPEYLTKAMKRPLCSLVWDVIRSPFRTRKKRPDAGGDDVTAIR